MFTFRIIPLICIQRVFGSFMKDAVCNSVMGSKEMESDEYTEKAFSATNIPLLQSPLIAINCNLIFLVLSNFFFFQITIVLSLKLHPSVMFPGIRDWLPVKMREGRIVNQNLFIFLNIMKEQIRKRWESDQVIINKSILRHQGKA